MSPAGSCSLKPEIDMGSSELAVVNESICRIVSKFFQLQADIFDQMSKEQF